MPEAAEATEPHHAHSQPRTSWYVSAVVVATMVVLFAPGTSRMEWQESFATYFIAIVLEALPFILLGAIISGLMETLLPADVLPRLAGKLGPLGIPVTALLAPFFPICECGVVVVGRGLLRKGLPLGHTITYLLAAPILNPTVILSTYFAFWDVKWPLLRVLGGLLVPVALGYAFSLLKPERVCTPEFAKSLVPEEETSHERREREKKDKEKRKKGLRETLLHLASHVRKDFVEMIPFFLFGVMIASGMKAFLGRKFLSQLGTGPWQGPVTMMLTAFVLSLCSEADAFVAASFTQFGLISRTGFLVYGPMLDIKLLLMYRTIFRTWFIALFAGAVTLAVALYLLLLGALL